MSESSADANGAGKLSSGDVVRLTEQIAGLTNAGLPLASGLRALSDEVSSPRLRRVLEPLAIALEAGTSLDSALAQQKGRVPSQLRSLILAGTRTGRMGEVLGRFAGYANIGADLRRTMLLRLVYPGISFAFATVVFIFAATVLMSGFEKIFADFGMSLPIVTRVVFSVANGVERALWPVTEVLLALVVLWSIVAILGGSAWRSIMMSEVPLIGPVWRFTALAEFCHLLALLVESDAPLVEALALAGEGVSNGALASAARAAAGDVATGNSLESALVTRRLFPSGFGQILRWAEGHRGLPDALHMAGEMFEARARSQAEFVSSACSVLVVISILGGVAMTVLAVMIPMINLISRLSG